MQTPRRSLNDCIPWHQVLDALKLPAGPQALPSVTRCPACKTGRLMILQDHLAGGQWHWCRKCGRGGDMIELAANTWKLSLAATIAKMASLGMPIDADREAIKAYVEKHTERRKMIHAFWNKCRKRYFQGETSAMRLSQTLKLGCDVSFERLESGMGHILGAAPTKEIDELMTPGNARSSFGGSRKRPWGDVLVIPFYDLPQRISAFLFVGREGKGDKDFVFRPVNIGAKWSRSKRTHGRHNHESGLAMHPSLFDVSTEWGGVVFAMDDPLLALRLQSRHLSANLKPLPIVAWSDRAPQEPQHSWQMLEGRELIMWAPHLDWGLIKQAIKTGAKISVAGPDHDLDDSMDSYIRRHTAEELLQQVRRMAVPWPTALSRHFSRLDNTELEEMLMQLRLSGVDLDTIIKRAHKKLVKRLVSVTNHLPVGRIIHMAKKTVVERKGGWYVEGAEPDHWEMIMNAQLRIEQVIWQEQSKRALYQGHLLHQEDKLPFCVERKELEKNAADYFHTLMMEHGKLLICDPKWSGQLATLAQQFHPPKVVQAAEIIGWDHDRQAFVLPQCSIAMGGELKHHRGGFPSTAPGYHFQPPEPLTGQELGLLTEGPAAAMLWAAITSVVANVLAPAFTQTTAGIATVGSTMSDTMQVVAEDLGCPLAQVSNAAASVEQTLLLEKAHRWPLRVSGPTKGASMLKFIDESRHDHRHRNCIVQLRWAAATVKRLTGGWHVLECGEPGAVTANQRVVLRQLLPAYLLDLAERRLHSEEMLRDSSWWLQVMNDLKHYLDRYHVDCSCFDESCRLYMTMSDGDRGNPEALADLTSFLVQTGKWAILPDGFQNDKRPTIVRITDEAYGRAAVGVPKAALSEWAAKEKLLLDIGAVTDTLKRTEVLLEDQDDYWVVQEDWWSSRMKLAQNERTNLLRVRA